jgi:hypothetical protein
LVKGGEGDDTLLGEAGADTISGEWGDDHIEGGDGNDVLYGDDADGDMYGKDKIWGGAGEDMIKGGQLDDEIHGGEGDDTLYGDAGEDYIWGDAGADTIDGGSGWDTIFGGDGCDTINTEDGGDVIWLGGCSKEEESMQTLNVQGTGIDPENYTVVMDFWLAEAKRYNQVCLDEDINQDGQLYYACDSTDDPEAKDLTPACVTALDLMDPRRLDMPGRVAGAGCKHDGGPLWISVPIQTECESDVVARFFQRGQKKPARRHRRRYAQGGFSEDELEECLAIYLCKTERCLDCDTSEGEILVHSGSFQPKQPFGSFGPNYGGDNRNTHGYGD